MQGWNLQTKASKSVPSPTSNLFHEKLSEEEINGKIEEFTRGFCRDFNVQDIKNHEFEGGRNGVNLLKKSGDDDNIEFGDLYHEVETIEQLENDYEKVEELSSWEWIYGKTPKFVLNDKEVKKGRYEDGKKFYL